MRKAIIILLLLCGSALAQTTTYTGTVRDLTNTAVTSGQVSFALQPGIDTTISGTARFVPTTTYCSITALGAIKALDGVAACVVTSNTSLTPTGTYYKVCIQAAYSQPGSCFNVYALGGSVDLTTVVPTPGTSPAYTFFDLISAQTVTGTKTWAADLLPDGDGTRAFGDATHRWNASLYTTTARKLNGVRFADQFAGANDTAKIDAAALDCGSNYCVVVIPSTMSSGCPSTLNDKISYLDFRGGTNVSCLYNVSTFGTNDGVVKAMEKRQMTVTSIPTNGSAVSFWGITTLKNASSPSDGIDGIAAVAQTAGTLSGTLPGMSGAEVSARVGSTGGAISEAAGAVGYVDVVAAATTALTTAYGVAGYNCVVGAAGTAPVNCYGLYGKEQTGGSTRNYSAGFEGRALFLYSTNSGSTGFDMEDSSHAKHSAYYLGGSNTINVQAIAAGGLYLRDHNAVARALADATGFALPHLAGGGTQTLRIDNTGYITGTGTDTRKFSATLSPASVAANTCAEETFTVTGVAAGDVLFVNKPTAQAGLGVAGVRAVGTNQAAINFCNTTALAIVPTASESYAFGVIR